MAIAEWRPEVVLDLSDEPVLGYRERMELASVSLVLGVSYEGADFRFDPPLAEPAPLGVPVLAVYGTGKRTGKTAIAGEVARRAARRDLAPIVIAMGRGGPPAPQVAEAGSVTLDSLIALVQAGEHAASDYLEDALTTGVTTIGARSLFAAANTSAMRSRSEPPVTRGSSSSRGAGQPFRPSRGTRGSSSSPRRVLPSTSAGTSGPTACCGLTWLLLPCLQARFPGQRTSPTSPLTCVARWAMRGSW